MLTAQAAAIGATTIFATSTTPGKGMYRVSYVATQTTAGTGATTAVLGGTTGFQLKFTNANGDTVVKTSAQTVVIGTANATTTTISGDLYCYAGASTNIQYLFGYTPGSTLAGAYDLAVYVEFLG